MSESKPPLNEVPKGKGYEPTLNFGFVRVNDGFEYCQLYVNEEPDHKGVWVKEPRELIVISEDGTWKKIV